MNHVGQSRATAGLQQISGLLLRSMTDAVGREMDVVLSQLAAAMPVDVMPGPSDPTNHSLPQQPLHGCLFPGSGGFATMNR